MQCYSLQDITHVFYLTKFDVMKKILVLSVLFLFGVAINASAQVLNHKEAVATAKEICKESGQTYKSGTNNDHTGSVSWSSSSSSNTSKTGTQNHYGSDVKGSANAAVISGALSGSYSRSGERTDTERTSNNGNSGTLYYKCEDND